MMFNKERLGKDEVQLQILDWDKECEKDIRTGIGFVVKEPPFSKDDTKNDFGIQSKFFGTDFGDDDAFEDRYSCKCGHMKGKLFEHELCPECHTTVELVDVDLDKYAWIVLDKYTLIHPMGYKFLSTVIGKQQLQDIISYDRKPDKNGNMVEEIDKKHPFNNIGMIEFKERYEEILYFYLKKKKQKKPLVEMLIKNKDKIFVHCIPVFSSVLRNILFISDNLITNQFDLQYNKLYSSVNALNTSEDNSILNSKKRVTVSTHVKLTKLQKTLMEIWQMCFDSLDTKNGHIKLGVIAGRINFTARNVIVPDKTLRQNEVKLSYICMMELYKFEIIAYLVNLQQISEDEAYDEWYRATINFSDKIYEIIKYMIKHRDMYILLNRPPTIDFGSIDRMKIVGVIPDIENLTLCIPQISVLSKFNADFDGDTLTLVSLKTKAQIRATEKFDPRLSYCVSQNDGLFSTDMGLIKDQIVGLSNFNRC